MIRLFPGVLFAAAAVLRSQTAPDPADVLHRTRANIVAATARLPKYACIQTIDRTYYTPSQPVRGDQSCDRMSADKKKSPLRLDTADRVRLDVAQGEKGEINSWPEATPFDIADIDRIVNRGPFGTGSFGGYLVDIFDNRATRYAYQGDKTRDGRHVLVYGYAVPQNASHYGIQYGTPEGDSRWITAYSGTFEVDPVSLEIGRITVQTSELPAKTGLCAAESTLDYQRLQIGDGSFLLPRQSQIRLTLRDGRETGAEIGFADCREYQAQSVVHFDTPSATPVAPVEAIEKRAPLPPGLAVELRLTAPIDTDIAAAGDAVSATVVHAVHASRSTEIPIPAGAAVHGRLTLVERHFVPLAYVVVGIAWESLETGGEPSPFSANLEGSKGSSSLVTSLAGTMQPKTPIPDGPPNSFVFLGEKRHVMAAGAASYWVTGDPPATPPK
jgi:hypothetical protein